MQINKLIANTSNFSFGRIEKISYIVIHYTANNKDTAVSNCKYFKTANRGASAHYFVDENEIWQSVLDKDTAWHCGTSNGYKHKYCRNANSIGIELCSEKDSRGNYFFNNETINKAIEITKYIMLKYDIPLKNVIRHFDVTGKNCPAPFVLNEVAWQNFKKQLENSLKEDNYLFVDRKYKFNNKELTFSVINENGENYIKIKDLANLLDKKVEYNAQTKVTTII